MQTPVNDDKQEGGINCPVDIYLCTVRGLQGMPGRRYIVISNCTFLV